MGHHHKAFNIIRGVVAGAVDQEMPNLTGAIHNGEAIAHDFHQAHEDFKKGTAKGYWNGI